ncbi:baseplate multidomain protein megatron [Caulobacter sp. NIBR2454]|uniref:baseplate multidomain protein megatron n=1 Tax=Caulobacter sp. NIBR2454 TaxID=3015996 RepID=UPI0022B6B9A8|nr:glycoside hydrolase/phage tail family protein [Caulobacter sp. NIBR2454]
MSQVVLGAAKNVVGSLAMGMVGGFLSNLLAPRQQVGPRIPELQMRSTAEGGPLPAVFGKARVAGQVIWAARFREHRDDNGGGKTPKTKSYRYSLSFAVALCEGPIDGIGRVWADGKPLDMNGVTMRLHHGAEDQAPDPLIVAVEGDAPAYGGVAYVVFEDLSLAPFGNRPPSLSFEVFNNPGAGLERKLKGVCLIPGAGEFVYAGETVLRKDDELGYKAENVNNASGVPDMTIALDQLAAQFPNLESVTLVVSWMGTDLRCGECEIKPGVESTYKETLPVSWRVAGLWRGEAHVISRIDAGPVYGGTPSDASVRQAIAALKARGWKVALYPFVMMDVPPGNGLPDPWGAPEQAKFPWRGRITCHPAAGRPGSPDGTSAAAEQAAAFFDREWGLRRMVLHYARLAAEEGVERFVIGSELRGLTTVRGAGNSYPAVTKLRDLAGDCRAILGPEVEITYAADWSEYFGHQPADGSGDLHFHLDPLWADEAVDVVGIDWYPPMADWRDGAGHLDAALGGPYSPAYLAAHQAGGENFDWFYASPEDRAAQRRTPITDATHGEPWVYRSKDLKSWWSNRHHDRPGGVRSATPTAWVPMSKPIRLIEFGCPAVDKGANSPNLFIDPKSSESFLPPFSNGLRDDLGQRRCLEAVLAHFDSPANNPTSPVYGGPMVAGASAWCWDARPYPDFPARAAVWKDAPNWQLGHWLTGRAGTSTLGDLVTAIGARAGVVIDPGDVTGQVTGYVIDRPMSVRDALGPLSLAFGFDARERAGVPSLVAQDGAATGTLGVLALPDGREAAVSASRGLEAPTDAVRARFIDETADYQTGALSVRRDPAGEGDVESLDLPIVCVAGVCEQAARRRMDRSVSVRRTASANLSMTDALRLEVGDRVDFEGGLWRVTRLSLDERPRADLEIVMAGPPPVAAPPEWNPPPVIEPVGPPVLHLLDLPGDERPLAALATDPWRPFEVHGGASVQGLTVRGRAEQPASVGVLVEDLAAGPKHRWDRASSLLVRLSGVPPQNRTESAVLGGANRLAVRRGGGWEIVQFAQAELVEAGVWRLSNLLRGQGGAAAEAVAAGAAVVMLDEALVRLEVFEAELGLPLIWRAAPAGGPPGGLAMTQAEFAWRGAALRPWAPAHLRARRVGEDVVVSWVRCARTGGDGWDGFEVPLGEEVERYRVQVVVGGAVVRTVEAAAPGWIYSAAMRATDGAGAGTVRVSQLSMRVGWGAVAEVSF